MINRKKIRAAATYAIHGKDALERIKNYDDFQAALSPATIISILDELESLCAWKAEIEKQEPVACVDVRDFEYHKSNGLQTSLGVWRTADYKSKLLPSEEPMFLYAAPVVSPDVEKLKSEIADLQVFCDRLNDRRNSLVGENQSLKNEAAFWKQETKTWADKHDELAESFQCHPNKPVIERLKTELEAARKDAERYRWLRKADQNTVLRYSHYAFEALDKVIDAAIEQAKGGV